MIEARNILKYYDSLHVLKGVNLNIARGEIVSIVGASGAGKTTLLQILGTLDKPEADKTSTLHIDGTDVLQLKDKALSKFRNQKLGFIFQFHQLLPEFTALENVCIPAFIAGKGKAETEAEAKKLQVTLDRSNALLTKLDTLAAKTDVQVFGDKGVMPETRATVAQLNALLGEARTSLKKVDAVLVDAQAVSANAREATNDLGTLRGEVEASLRKVDGLINEINRKWPFKRDTEVKLP